MYKSKSRRRQGFTLMEVLIVVAIIAILVAIAIPLYTAHLEKARYAVCLANRRAIYAEASYACLDGSYADVESAFNALYAEKQDIYICPKGGVFSWSPGAEGAVGGVIVCSYHDAAAGVEYFPGTDLEVWDSWENAAAALPVSGYQGGIFKQNGAYYIVCTDQPLYGQSPTLSIVVSQKKGVRLTGDIIVYAGADVSVPAGTLLKYGDDYYVSTTVNSFKGNLSNFYKIPKTAP